MDNWWEFGERDGHVGGTLALSRITCAFCGVAGNFNLEHSCEKKHAVSSKVLHFDTYKCENCANFILIFWSSGQPAFGGVHNYRCVPWPLKFDLYPDHWPEAVGRNWLQAKKSLAGGMWDAAAVMARASMQAALREKQATGKDLYQEIEDLAGKGLLPPLLKDWATELRRLGNDAAHPDIANEGTTSADATQIVKFLDFLLEYLYDLPFRIAKYRKVKSEASGSGE